MEKSRELVDAYQRFFREVQDGSLTSIQGRLSASDAVSGIGTDPSEWWMGRESLASVLDAQAAFLRQLGVIFDTSNAVGWTDGDFGFVIDQPTWTLRDGRSVQCRTTTIFHREGGTWKIVHLHVSIGVANDQVEAFRGVE